MNILTLLADAQASDPLKLVGQGIVVLLTATGLASLFVRGFYVKFVEPMFLNTVTTWYTHESQTKARQLETQSTVNTWYTNKEQTQSRQLETQTTVQNWYRSPEVQAERKTHTETVLENHIRRDDGLIHLEINNRVAKSADDLKAQISKQEELLEKQAEENRKFQQEILTALKELQTSVSYLHGRHAAPANVPGGPITQGRLRPPEGGLGGLKP